MRLSISISTVAALMMLFPIEGFSQEFTVTENQNQYAFIIGIDHYDDQTINNLASCRLDALRFKSKLAHSRGANIPENNISMLLDPTKQSIQEALSTFLQQIKDPSGSSVYFYFSGHGVPGGIIPANYSNNDPLSMLSYSWITQQLKDKGIGNSIYVIDACYSGSILSSKSAAEENLAYITARDQKTNSKTVIFTATNAYRVTPAGKHQSVYSRYFLNALDNFQADLNQDGILTAGELNQLVQQNLGDVFEPQFYGATEFPLISRTAKVRQLYNARTGRMFSTTEAKATPEREGFSSGNLNLLIQWRADVESRLWTPESTTRYIDSLKSTGTPEALSKIGFLYRNGIGVKQDYNVALSYFITALEGQCGFAAYNLGYLYSKGLGLQQDPIKAMHYYERAAQMGDPYGQYNLGIAHSNKAVTSKNSSFDTATSWLEKSANQGFVNAQSTLGILLKERATWVVKPGKQQQIHQQSIKWLTAAAMAGDGRAQFELGNTYRLGLGTSESIEEAKKWYIEACKNKELRACRKVMMLDYALSKN